ncbi:MAG: proline--tRNA ligase [Nanoarchaeota archaeon]|nr:proline--tRNA ligase [Nanoarchaeota archaeon]
MAEKNIGITVKKADNISEWYTQVIQKAELADYTKVSGCMVIRPRAYEMWEKVQDYFNKRIKALGVKNAYFPLFIPESLLLKEKEHVEGFSPEVAWVTHAGNSKLNERLAIRPTSETIMYDSYKNWIRSYNDLPLKINQWCNIVRWEFKNPMPFLRGREFLWQEGHSVFATREEAEEEIRTILDIYADVMEKLYAVPVMKGKKSNVEKFAGAVETLSIETILPSGKAIQIATTHFLGQNFSKAFGISYLDRDEKKKHPWQTSWGISTRTLGIMTMIHGDDKGMIVPPRVAPVHGVIVPIRLENDKKAFKEIEAVKEQLNSHEIVIDERTGYTPGFKFNDWEMKGIPVRIEIGPKDIENKSVMLVRRDTGEKKPVKVAKLKEEFKVILDDIQKNLLNRAKESMEKHIVEVSDYASLKKAIKDKKVAKAYFCCEDACEEEIAEETTAKTLNMPFKQPNLDGKKCMHSGKDAKALIYFGRSY